MNIFITTNLSATYFVLIICFERKRKNTIKKAKRSTEKKNKLRSFYVDCLLHFVQQELRMRWSLQTRPYNADAALEIHERSAHQG